MEILAIITLTITSQVILFTLSYYLIIKPYLATQPAADTISKALSQSLEQSLIEKNEAFYERILKQQTQIII